MALYYNRHHGSLALATRSGKPAVFPGKAWVRVSDDQEGSEEILDAVRKGFLSRFEEPSDSKPEKSESKPEPETALPAPVPAVELAVMVESKKEKAEVDPPKRKKG